MGEKILLIDSIIKYASSKNIPGLFLFVDFEKAFDSLDWTFIIRTLENFGFGPSFIHWIKLFYTDTESCVLNNGWASNTFKLQRGVRQGCPLSPYLFILSAEILAKAVRKNNIIKGICVNNEEIKLSQYADDTTFILDGTKESLKATFHLLERFSLSSGLRINHYKKTEALWIGSCVGKEENLLPEKISHGTKVKLNFWVSGSLQIPTSP